MNARLGQALNVYLSQRWTLPVLAFFAVAGGVLLMLLSRAGDRMDGFPLLLANAMGLPAMLASFWVTSVAKWQFVNPRARMLPAFARSHLAVIAGWYVAALVIYPLIVALAVLPIDPLASVAYALACGALFSWSMHTGRPALSLAGMVVFFAPAVPALAPFWSNDIAGYTTARLLVAAAGLVGLATWLRALSTLTEESDSYLIPTQAQVGKASRMEKSEARRNEARQIARSRAFGWLIDRWHDQLERIQVTDLAGRRRLLRYGFVGAPPWARCLWMILLFGAVMGLNTFCFVADGRQRFATMLPAGFMFAFVGPVMVAQLVAMRRSRMQAELMLPMRRTDYIGGLFRALARETLMMWGLVVTLLGSSVIWLYAELITTQRFLAAGFALATGVVATHGLALHAALIESGMKRIFLLLLGIYAVIGLLAIGTSLYLWVIPIAGLAVVAAVLGVGLLLIKWAFSRWMAAELG